MFDKIPQGEPFDLDNFPSDATIELLKQQGYNVKETEHGFYPTSRMGAIIRGWAKTERQAWRHCYFHYSQIQDKNGGR